MIIRLLHSKMARNIVFQTNANTNTGYNLIYSSPLFVHALPQGNNEMKMYTVQTRKEEIIKLTNGSAIHKPVEQIMPPITR